jgi:Domain of unknown function (DUF4328)
MTPSPNAAPFTSAHVRARIVKILLIVGAGAAVFSLLAESFSLVFPPLADDQELGENVMGAVVAILILLLAILEFLIYVATAVFFLMWLYRAHNNLRAFNPWNRPDYSAGWAVGSFFIPFVNLVVPFRAVKEVWQKSWTADETVLSVPSAPASFSIWWTFWLLSCFAGNISMRLSFNENVPESTATIVSIIASALSIVAAAFAYLVVDAIDKRQEEASAKINLAKFSGPPPPPTFSPLSDVVAPAP